MRTICNDVYVDSLEHFLLYQLMGGFTTQKFGDFCWYKIAHFGAIKPATSDLSWKSVGDKLILNIWSRGFNRAYATLTS
jgi:hypothetical protein